MGFYWRLDCRWLWHGLLSRCRKNELKYCRHVWFCDEVIKTRGKAFGFLLVLFKKKSYFSHAIFVAFSYFTVVAFAYFSHAIVVAFAYFSHAIVVAPGVGHPMWKWNATAAVISIVCKMKTWLQTSTSLTFCWGTEYLRFTVCTCAFEEIDVPKIHKRLNLAGSFRKHFLPLNIFCLLL